VRSTVREAYGRIASGGGTCCGPKKEASCCGASGPDTLARKLGYAEEELAALPEGANLGLSCGNPAAVARLTPGETVLDLGSGGGFDVFVCATKVGRKGRVIGVDMTPEMVSRARGNIAAFRERTGLANVEFRLGEIEHLPVADASVDVVISNCVLNLSPQKPQVWREIARVLRPGGRVAVSDLALVRPLPPAVRTSAEALVSCFGGAALVKQTEKMVRAAGLVEIALDPQPIPIDDILLGNLAVIDEFHRATLAGLRAAMAALPAGRKLGDYVVSLYISARKPR
jgi:SAM-dependent methyltransferase